MEGYWNLYGKETHKIFECFIGLLAQIAGF